MHVFDGSLVAFGVKEWIFDQSQGRLIYSFGLVIFTSAELCRFLTFYLLVDNLACIIWFFSMSVSFLVFVDAFWLGEILMWDNRASMIFYLFARLCI